MDNLMSYITVNLIEDFGYSAWEKKIKYCLALFIEGL